MRHLAWAWRAALWLSCCAPLAAHADTPQWQFKATALGAAPLADGAGSAARVTLEPSVKWTFGGAELRARERLRWLQWQGKQRTDFDVRELTAAWRGGEHAVTLGAQQLNWGRMDILRVTDLVNPVDQQDLFVEELPEAKRAVAMANWEWQRGADTLQVAYAPRAAADRLPQRWGGMPVQAAPTPGATLQNATLAARYGFEVSGWNADLLVLRGWQTTPALRPVGGAGGLTLQAALSRQHSIGFSADKALGAVVVRVEGLAARLRPDANAAALGVLPGRQLTLGAGVDVRDGAWFIAAQGIAQRDTQGAGAAARSTFASVIVQRKWLQDRLSGRALHIRELRSGSSWTSLQAAYELSANQVLQLQGDRFCGAPTQAFGSFSDRSRIAASLRVQF